MPRAVSWPAALLSPLALWGATSPLLIILVFFQERHGQRRTQ
jgi:hypothetical protein